MSKPHNSLVHGLNYPYDERAPKDSAHMAALGILSDLSGRGGIGDELDQIDSDIREEIVNSLADIIRSAYAHPELCNPV